mmetsp:Transcript_33276/g.53453  ORF Transcript_33276/g.53453 Transcript_33276/m.53453 type:complete len:228 (+) Transcript_33276:334-1017(+)
MGTVISAQRRDMEYPIRSTDDRAFSACGILVQPPCSCLPLRTRPRLIVASVADRTVFIVLYSTANEEYMLRKIVFDSRVLNMMSVSIVHPTSIPDAATIRNIMAFKNPLKSFALAPPSDVISVFNGDIECWRSARTDPVSSRVEFLFCRLSDGISTDVMFAGIFEKPPNASFSTNVFISFRLDSSTAELTLPPAAEEWTTEKGGAMECFWVWETSYWIELRDAGSSR